MDNGNSMAYVVMANSDNEQSLSGSVVCTRSSILFFQAGVSCRASCDGVQVEETLKNHVALPDSYLLNVAHIPERSMIAYVGRRQQV